jgi:hypothetical protein
MRSLISGAGVLKLDKATHGERLFDGDVVYIVRRSRRRSGMWRAMI